MIIKNPLILQRPLSRAEYFQVVRTALATGHNLFARQAVLNWLATFPGDLRASLYFARALTGENRLSQAGHVLQKLCILDPEDLDAVQTYLDVIMLIKAQKNQPGLDWGLRERESEIKPEWSEAISSLEMTARAHRFALQGPKTDGEEIAPWGGPIWIARQALEKGEMQLASSLMDDAVSQVKKHPLGGIIHLQFLEMGSRESPEYLVDFARKYHQLWPDTLYFLIRLADWTSNIGRSDDAVALLHEAAARDIEGRVIQRIWGKGHPYQSLWPRRMQLKMDLMIPSPVMELMGWNQLPSGSSEPSKTVDVKELKENQGKEDIPVILAVGKLSVSQSTAPIKSDPILDQEKSRLTEQETLRYSVPASRAKKNVSVLNHDLLTAETELEKLASRYKLTGLTRQDGRFPIYIVFSLRGRLKTIYGEKVAELLEVEMKKLALAVRNRTGWGGRVMIADDPEYTLKIGSKPVKPEDPWACKLLIADLDEWLRKRGERIGAILIVGGPEIVPFHHLPNPVDDPDHDIPSDNPYSTRDENYFIPEWPVGRLPGGAGSDARLLLESLRRFQEQHGTKNRKVPQKHNLSRWIQAMIGNISPSYRRSFGYTAEIWREAAGLVFSSIGRPVWMHVSPPSGLKPEESGGITGRSNGLRGIPAPSGRMGYFNLHGKVNVPEWFGHRDPMRFSDEPDYPIALRPSDIGRSKGVSSIPQVVFSEACYGMHIKDRVIDETIVLKFLEAGSLAVVGSTSMAYGAVLAAPMVAADMLGFTFWRFLKRGMPAGEALRQAKIYLASEMHRRQEYLDGEDQKTLISFILYGDPLAELISKNRTPKSVRYRAKPLAKVQTVCDREDKPGEPIPVPMEVMDGVRRAVAKYLPGMIDARLAYSCEHELHSMPQKISEEQSCLHQRSSRSGNGLSFDRKDSRLTMNFRNLVTLSKQVSGSGETHLEIARLTLDEHGKLVKMVVSR